MTIIDIVFLTIISAGLIYLITYDVVMGLKKYHNKHKDKESKK